MPNLMPYRFRNLSPRPSAFFSDDFFRPFFSNEEKQEGSFRIDVSDKGDHFLLEADLPGVDKDQLKIEVDDNVLTIAAEVNETKSEEKDSYIYNERRVGRFQRSFTLRDVKEDGIAADYKDGVLKLTLPKMAEEAKSARRIELN